MRNQPLRKATVAALAAASLATIQAQTNPWEVTGAAGLSLADGNASSIAYSLQLLGSRITETDELYLGADYFYAADKGIDTTNTLRLAGQYNRLINERFYYGIAGSYLTDNVADLDYRFDLNALLGYYILKNGDTYSLAVEAGPGYTWEKQGGVSNDYMNIRFGEKFEYNISPGAKFWQTLSFTPEASDFSNYLLTADIGLDTFITQQWALRTFFRYQRDNTPAAGRKADDYSVMVGLAYSLAGFPEPEKPGRRTLKPAREEKPVAAMGWTTTAAAGYSLNSGNSDSSAFTLTYDTAHRSATDEFFFNGAYAFGENNGTTSVSTVRSAIQYNWLIQPNYFAGVGTGFFHDDLADLKYRITPAVVAGIYLIKDEAQTLSLEAGPGYTFEKTGNTSSDFFALQAAERFAYSINPRCTFNQALIYNTEAADFDNFTLTATAFLDTDITTNLALRVAAAYIYDNTPAAGREHHDTTLTSGIAVKF